MTRDLVVCSLEAWDSVWRRNQFLVAGLLDRDPDLRVLFVEPATDPLYQLARRQRPQRARGLRAESTVAPGRLWTCQQAKLAPRRLGSFVDGALSSGVLRAARRLGLREPLLWINDPGRSPLLAATGWPALYDITDDWVQAARSPRELAQVRANEALLLRHCGQVVVCSPALAADKGAVRPVELVPNAVELGRYTTPLPRPADLPPGPVAVYAGTLHADRLDVGLCARTAAALAGVGTLVFVGPNALSVADTAALRKHDNVRLLGARPYPTIPGYLQHADLLVVPHVIDAFTDSLDPIKLYEYLAVGRPVVATSVAGFRDAPPPVRVAAAADFPSAVADLVTRSVASVAPPTQLPTWDDRVVRFAAVLAALAGDQSVEDVRPE